MINKLLDLSIIYSFDSTGFKRHAKTFSPLTFEPSKLALVTGGTSGIGKAAAIGLAENNIKTIITGRNEEKGKQAEQNNISFLQNDIGNWQELDDFVDKLPALDYLVLNAGGMPDKDIRNHAGIESQAASQLFGHYYLLHKLHNKQKLKDGARVVWVTSGGMYLKKFDFEELIENKKYDKVSTYANVKRAQVTLLSHMKDLFPNYKITAMHPGWVDTDAVRDSIPGFHKMMGKRLRTTEEGADTILWILASSEIESGELYFDRKIAKKHAFWFTKVPDQEVVDQLKSYLESNLS